jgi:hypothetical protein
MTKNCSQDSQDLKIWPISHKMKWHWSDLLLFQFLQAHTRWTVFPLRTFKYLGWSSLDPCTAASSEFFWHSGLFGPPNAFPWGGMLTVVQLETLGGCPHLFLKVQDQIPVGMVLTCWWKTMSTRRMTAEMISLFSCPAILDGKLWFLLCWIFPSHAHKVFSSNSQQSWTEGVSSSSGLVVCISVRIRFLSTNLLMLKVQKMWSKRFHTRNLNG